MGGGWRCGGGLLGVGKGGGVFGGVGLGKEGVRLFGGRWRHQQGRRAQREGERGRDAMPSAPHPFSPPPPPTTLRPLSPHNTLPPQVTNINLAGLDRVIAVFAAGDTERSLLLRQYRLRLKKGATPKLPRAALEEMGPALDMVVRRHRLAGPDLEREAMKRPQVAKKKVGPLAPCLASIPCVPPVRWCAPVPLVRWCPLCARPQCARVPAQLWSMGV